MHPAADATRAPVLADLDPAQAQAVSTPSTLVAVIAGAGSGKTRVLTRRIAFRIGVGTADARHTLALTFTREAAGELRRRLRRSGLREHVEAGTFHAVALGLLRQRWEDIGQRPPTLITDRERLLADVTQGVPLATLTVEADWMAARGLTADDYVNAARDAGRRGATAPDRIAERLAAYEILKRRRGVVDLDDVLAMVPREMDRDTGWADAVRWRFRTVLVDEAQDINPLQYRLLQHIVGGRDDLYLVGDPAQAIYGFNGSDPDLLVDVAERLPGVEIIHLPTNHRSTPQIVAAGIHVLASVGYASDAVSARADGPAIRVLPADDEDHEVALVAALVRSLDPAVVRSGGVAVLGRTNAQLGRLSTGLTEIGLPIRRDRLTAGSPLATAVRLATGVPSATRLRAWAHDTLDSVPTVGVSDPIDQAERQVAGAVLEFLRDQPLGDGSALRTWIASTNPFAEADAVAGVELLTFHGAKGREWNTVVITGVETGLVPHRSATTIAARHEEARLLQVAMTRATDRLVLTWAARRGGYGRKASPLLDGLNLEPSPFVPPPPELRSVRRPDPLERLLAWRDAAARAIALLPEELCSNADLAAILAANPMTPDELAAATTLGPLTAARLFPAIRRALDAMAS